MIKAFAKLFLCGFLLLPLMNVRGQDLTVILFRHAERFPSTKENNFDPELTAEGKARAEKLLEVLRKYKPEQIFSTNTKRTRATVEPAAENLLEKYRIQIQVYDTEDEEAFAERLLKSGAKTVAVAGHSNTVPKIANTLLKQEKYTDFADDEYNKIIIVKIKNGKASDTAITY